MGTLHFGRSLPIYRTDFGTLRCREINKIYNFLLHRGLVISECYDGYVALVHPDLAEKVEDTLLGLGLTKTLLAASFHQLYDHIQLPLYEARVMEILCPGSLLVIHDEGQGKEIGLCIPDSYDLRDIGSAFGGVIKAFYWSQGGMSKVTDIFQNERLKQNGILQYGVMDSPFYEEYTPDKMTVVKINAPDDIECRIEGKIDSGFIKDASKNVSEMEIGEWM